ncbi:MAG TPA: TonB-dependent receptor [Thermoanaerobaculia bacterium]|nr:TonB-dependent receptor [Thermoanaerobaculia bacterium]
MNRRISLLCAVLSACALLFTLPMSAQDFRGTISGTVTDSTGGVLPGVTVTVTNAATNIASTTVTDAKGFYRVPFLLSGSYRAEAQLEGLKTAVRRDIVVRISENITADFVMEAGGMSEVISVTASVPVLDTNSASTGQIIDSNQIEQLPLGDGTAYMLTRLAPGVSDTSDLHFSRPMDNAGLSGIVANGALGGNDFTLDGAPNRVSPNNTSPGNNSGVVGFSPPSVAIAEFKVLTNSFDAQAGHTAGASVNLALKSGTNEFLGTLAAFNRSDSRAATPLLSERAGSEKPTRDYNRYTGMLSGPIVRDRTFFMVSFERLKDVQPEPASYTVPTAKMRAGDLSEWLPGVVIYDPRTATGSTNTRQPFPGNIIPADRIHPIARAYASYYPEANRPGLENNYFTNQPRPYDYNALLGRIDHNFNGSNRLFANGYWNKREEDRYNWAKGAANATGEGAINGFEVTHGFDFRSNTGVTLGLTSVMANNLVFDVISSWSKFSEWREAAQEFDPATLGFSAETVALMNGYQYLPFITFGGFSTTNSNSRIASLGSQRSDFGLGFDRPFQNLSFVPTASWLWRAHSLKGGYELRRQQWEIQPSAYGAGRYHFAGTYTRLNNSAAQNILAQSWAQFLLGIPTTATNTVASPGSTSSQFEIAADADYRQDSHALFLQDDWHVNDRLTLNMGLRFEYDRALTESDDRNLGGFDRTISSPIEAAALANYAANPIPQIPVGQFAVRGGLQFADGAIYNDMDKIMPRLGFSYLLNEKTVLRGGAGLFSYQYYFDAGNQLGFSQPTGIITTENNGGIFLTDLSNPIPSGQLTPPPGSSRGAATGLGLNIGTVVPSEREVPYYTRWQLGAQREVARGWLVELFYVNSKGRNLPVRREINGIPFEYLSTATQRDTANEALLSGTVSNPFRGMLPGTGINGNTVARSQLLRPFPQFLSIVTEEYRGSDEYQAGTIRVEKRFSGGNSLLTTYTRSRARDKLFFLNPSNGVLEDRISPNDRPNRFTVGATLALPFGDGRRWGSNWGGLTNALLGGWTTSMTYQYQSGFPLLFNNNIYYDPSRNPHDLRSNIGGNCSGGGIAGLDCAAWDTSGFFIPGGTGRTDPRLVMGNTVRRFPSTIDGMRSDDLHLMDVGVYKNFALPGSMRFQLRIEAINALNYTVLWNPNVVPTNASFGLVNQDRNNPRDIQIGGRLTF